jgi:glycosyltransferase involved in cell wall biosynthesis
LFHRLQVLWRLSQYYRQPGVCVGSAVPLKILHIVPHFDNSGNGVVNAAIDLACTQAGLGMSVALIGVGAGSFRDLLQRSGVTVYSLPGSSPRNFFLYFLRVLKVLREFRPDIVHAHFIPGAIIAWLYRFGLHYKLITSVHSSGRRGSRLLAVGDLIICVSEYLASEMRAHGLPSRKLRIVRNGPLGSPRLQREESAGCNLKSPAIVTIAEMASHKGLSDLISAFSMLADRKPKPHLYILGHGVDRHTFERQAAASPLSDRIVFCGFVANPGAYLKSADIFVLASHREGFGLALAEARSSGCAIVASNVGGIPEVLDGGAAGILVPPHSPELLANALSDLLENPGKRELLRSKAGSNLEWLSCLRTATETIAVYNEACGRTSQEYRERPAVAAE